MKKELKKVWPPREGVALLCSEERMSYAAPAAPQQSGAQGGARSRRRPRAAVPEVRSATPGGKNCAAGGNPGGARRRIRPK